MDDPMFDRTERHTLDIGQRVIARGAETSNIGRVRRHLRTGYTIIWDGAEETVGTITFSDIEKGRVEALVE